MNIIIGLDPGASTGCALRASSTNASFNISSTAPHGTPCASASRAIGPSNARMASASAEA